MQHKPRVLLIEDAVDIRMFVRIVLQNSFEVAEAADGLEGMNMLDSLTPDVIVTDLMMPGLSGRDLISGLIKKAGPSIPLLVVSADRLAVERLQEEFPKVSFMAKPFIPAELRTKVWALLQQPG